VDCSSIKQDFSTANDVIHMQLLMDRCSSLSVLSLFIGDFLVRVGEKAIPSSSTSLNWTWKKLWGMEKVIKELFVQSN
jgi:hypothetical protein